MNSVLVEIHKTYRHPMLLEFLDALADHDLQFRASSLASIFENQDEINFAMKRAMQICTDCGLPIGNHFKPVYLADITFHGIKVEWKLSKLAYYLAMLNGHPDNPIVGRIQLEILKQII